MKLPATGKILNTEEYREEYYRNLLRELQAVISN